MNLREGLIETFIIFTGLALAVVFLVTYAIDDFKTIRHLHKNGTLPTPLRALTPHEKDTLYRLYKHHLVLVVLSTMLLGGLTYVILTMTGYLPPVSVLTDIVNTFSTFFLVWVFTGIIAYTFLLSGMIINIRNAIRVRKDLTSEVYELQDIPHELVLISGRPGRFSVPRYWIYIGSVRFYFKIHDKKLWQFFHTIKNSDTVHVTFSPHSKHIWDIKKV